MKMIENKTERLQKIEEISSSVHIHIQRRSLKMALWRLTVAGAEGVKRFFDIICSLILLIFLLPLFVLTGLIIYLEDPGSIFYKQIRVGKNGSHFDFYKFRSMVVDADRLKTDIKKNNESKDGVIFKMKKDPRVTRIGRIIRKYSIDELPQLINVLRGDMSLVGPRPALPEEVALYTLEQRKRLHVVPGITCIWQVSGRSEIPFSGQVKLDVEYIKSTSFWGDIVILLKTIPAVISGKGAY